MNHSGDANKMVGEDHIPDATKMVSDTPRTEAEVNRQKCWSDDLVTIDANFACQLERELNAANQRIKRLEDARTVAAANSLAIMLAYEDAVAKIKRLEEAGDYLEYDLKEIWSETRSMREWTKAKEAKP